MFLLILVVIMLQQQVEHNQLLVILKFINLQVQDLFVYLLQEVLQVQIQLII